MNVNEQRIIAFLTEECCYLNFLRSKVRTQLRWCGKFYSIACRISSRLKWYKNYKNRLRLAKVIVKNKMSRFMVHCVEKKFTRRWESERKHRVHALQNTIDSYINSARDRRGYVLERRFTKFSEITQYNGLLVINTNLASILHHFQDKAFDRSKISIFRYPSCLTPPTEVFPWDDLRKTLPGCQWVAKVPNGVKRLPKISIAWVGCTNVTDRRQTTVRRQTDGRAMTYSDVHVR